MGAPNFRELLVQGKRDGTFQSFPSAHVTTLTRPKAQSPGQTKKSGHPGLLPSALRP